MKSLQNKLLTAVVSAAGAVLFVSAAALANDLEKTEKPFSVKLGLTRIIYPSASAGQQLPVSNMQDYPILIHSAVTAEDKKSPAPFMVTPPLFRLEAGQQSRLRIIRTGGGLPEDRESLFWVCVQGIPPEDDHDAAPGGKPTLALKVSVKTCDKLLYRPSGLRGSPDAVAQQVTWTRQGDGVQVHNPTPFYMNLTSVSVGGRPLSNAGYVAPQGTVTLPLPAGPGGEVEWKVITDYGGDSRAFRAVLK